MYPEDGSRRLAFFNSIEEKLIVLFLLKCEMTDLTEESVALYCGALCKQLTVRQLQKSIPNIWVKGFPWVRGKHWIYVFFPSVQVCLTGPMQTCSPFPSRGLPLSPSPTMQVPEGQVRQYIKRLYVHVLSASHNLLFLYALPPLKAHPRAWAQSPHQPTAPHLHLSLDHLWSFQTRQTSWQNQVSIWICTSQWAIPSARQISSRPSAAPPFLSAPGETCSSETTSYSLIFGGK